MKTMDTDRRVLAAEWRSLVHASALVAITLLLIAAVLLRDTEAAAIAVLGAGALVLTRFRTGLLGVLALGVLFANVSAWMVPGAVSNLRHGEAVIDALLPGALAIVSVTGVAGVLGWVLTRWRGRPGRGTARALGVGGLIGFALLGLLSVAGTGRARTVAPGDLILETHQAKYSADVLRARTGRVTVRMSNQDLFWHTFTVPELGVDLNVPVRGDRSVTFEARAGRYEFICAIPGHTALGMKGVLVVA